MVVRSALPLLVAAGFVGQAALAQTGSIRGTVIDKDFNAPLGGVAIQVVENGARVLTGELGDFLLPQLPAGTYTLIARKDGYVDGVKSNVVVAPGAVARASFELLGDFTDLEEFVVREGVEVQANNETALLNLRFESPAMVDAISSELMANANASDAADALRLVSGASTREGKSAVIRGLPDRYVSSQMNGVLLPTGDADKRAVELDQFPSTIIDNLQVAKTFTPDQQGNASGGAVNVVLRGVPDKPLFMNWKFGVGYNENVTGRGDFLSYDGGGVHAFGRAGDERVIQEENENWTGAVGASPGEAPDIYNWQGSLGGKIELQDGWRVGGFANFFYRRDASFYKDGRDDSWILTRVGDLLSPQINLGSITQTPFVTSLYDVTRSQQQVQWGGLATLGIASDDHAITGLMLFTDVAEDTVTYATDTRGKQYFFPGHDPENPNTPGWNQQEAAPYNRQQTLAYVERATRSSQINGKHRFDLYSFGPLRRLEIDWSISESEASRDTPDRREFSYYWTPGEVFVPLKPAAEFALGNLQRTFIRVEEKSMGLAGNLKLPFEVWGDREGYVKTGYFADKVKRTFRQETFSNFQLPGVPVPPPFTGPFNGIDWSQNWAFEERPISGAETDVDYDGNQDIAATYLMVELPLIERMRVIGGVRWENSRITTTNDWEEEATFFPRFKPDGTLNAEQFFFPIRPGEPNFNQEAYDAIIDQINAKIDNQAVLPAISLVYEVLDGVTLRGSYAETIARQTFKEITPVFQQEYIGGPVFVGDPNLEISEVQNWDLRLDLELFEGSLFSASYFKKLIRNPIEYVEVAQPFRYTRPVNYPRGTLKGFEVELRQDFGPLWEPLAGLNIGGNSTWIDSEVRLPDIEIAEFEEVQGVRPALTRPMTNAPKYLWNTFLTYSFETTGTSIGAFYTVTGDTLVQGQGPGTEAFSPTTIDTRYDRLSVTLRQDLGRGVQLSFAASNLTDDNRRQVYRSEFIPEDVTRFDFRTGVSYSVSLSGEIRF